MLSKSKSNFIISLQKKKIREEENLYVVEGDKIVREYLMAKIPIKLLAANPSFINTLPTVLKEKVEEIIPIGYDELKKVSSLKSPHNALAVVYMPDNGQLPEDFAGLSAALEFVQDPGNLGTIIRAAAWFGIKRIYCSEDCVDVFNPKVIQSSMGAILRVEVKYTSLNSLLGKAKEQNIKVFGAVLNGEPIYNKTLDKEGIILLGNESKGISEGLMEYVTDKIMVPFYGEISAPGIESLNVSMAASVIFSEFARR